jgi:hypothetical protein
MLTIVIAIVTSVVLVTLLIALYTEFKIFESRVESFIRMDEIYTMKLQNILSKHFDEEEKALAAILKWGENNG